ncbi:Nuclear actin-protein involved in chromatin remodeling [Tulasnella sp. 418]|nr:Nuclear actin-protein involved in chromatin remodeling [Tulasnella sp. 418]
MAQTETTEVYHFPEPPTPDAVEFETNYSFHLNHRTPIVIDNGSTNFRFGWASSSDPYVSPNLYAKYRDKRSNRAVLLFGDAVEADTQGKGTAKSPWEGDHLNNHEALESALDYTFLRLGVDAETVDHPVIMTERLCTISHSRSLTSEMLFELYSVPSVTYAVDALTSFAHNVPDVGRDGLVISFNTASTSIIPVLSGRGIFAKTKRLPWGGQQASEYLLKLVQLKYSGFPTRVTSTQSTWMYQTFSEFSLDYAETLRVLDDPVEMSRASKVVQFPFAAPAEKIKTEEELAALAEKRREAGRRLQEQAAKKRVEKIMEKEKDLETATNLREWKDKESKTEFAARLRQNGFESEQEWEESIKRLEMDLKKARKKDLGDEEPAEEPTFPLLDVADSELDEESLKEKRRQKLMKGLHEARLRAKQEKEKEKAAAAEEERLEAIEREQNPDSWKDRWRKEHETVVTKLKNRERRKVDLQDRKSAASQSRMKSIANLTGEQPPLKKRRRKGGDGTLDRLNRKAEHSI